MQQIPNGTTDAGPQQWRGQISLAYPTAAQLKEAAERLRHLQSKDRSKRADGWGHMGFWWVLKHVKY